MKSASQSDIQKPENVLMLIVSLCKKLPIIRIIYFMFDDVIPILVWLLSTVLEQLTLFSLLKMFYAT